MMTQTQIEKALETSLKRIKDLEDNADESHTALGLLIKMAVKLSRKVDDGNTAAALGGKNWIPLPLFGDLEEDDMPGAWKLAKQRLTDEQAVAYHRKQLKLLEARKRVRERAERAAIKARGVKAQEINQNGGEITTK
jgi:hypothetical protein